MNTKPTPMLNQAAFTIETVAHLRGLERDLLPQAQFLRDLQAAIFRLANAVGDEERESELSNLLAVWTIQE